MLAINSNTDQSDIDEISHAGRYPVYEILRKRAQVEVETGHLLLLMSFGKEESAVGEDNKDNGFDDGHAQQVKRDVQQGRCGGWQARHDGGCAQGIQHGVNHNQVDASWILDTECETDVASDPLLFLEVSGLKKHEFSNANQFFQLSLADKLLQLLVTETN